MLERRVEQSIFEASQYQAMLMNELSVLQGKKERSAEEEIKLKKINIALPQVDSYLRDLKKLDATDSKARLEIMDQLWKQPRVSRCPPNPKYLGQQERMFVIGQVLREQHSIYNRISFDVDTVTSQVCESFRAYYDEKLAKYGKEFDPQLTLAQFTSDFLKYTIGQTYTGEKYDQREEDEYEASTSKIQAADPETQQQLLDVARSEPFMYLVNYMNPATNISMMLEVDESDDHSMRVTGEYSNVMSKSMYFLSMHALSRELGNDLEASKKLDEVGTDTSLTSAEVVEATKRACSNVVEEEVHTRIAAHEAKQEETQTLKK